MKNYIILVAGEPEIKRNSLKEARKLVQAILNVNEVRGIVKKIEIIKEVTTRKKIDEVTSNPSNTGTVDKVFA